MTVITFSPEEDDDVSFPAQKHSSSARGRTKFQSASLESLRFRRKRRSRVYIMTTHERLGIQHISLTPYDVSQLTDIMADAFWEGMRRAYTHHETLDSTCPPGAFYPYPCDGQSLHAQARLGAWMLGYGELLVHVEDSRTVFNGVQAHALAQHAFLRLFLQLNSAGALGIFHAASRIGIDDVFWQILLSGPAAVAVVARQLQAMKYRVMLPSVADDVRRHIDLLAYHPESESGVCVQVKSIRRTREYSHVYSPTPETYSDDEEMQKLVAGTQAFNDWHDTVWKPIYVQVGSDTHLFSTKRQLPLFTLIRQACATPNERT